MSSICRPLPRPRFSSTDQRKRKENPPCYWVGWSVSYNKVFKSFLSLDFFDLYPASMDRARKAKVKTQCMHAFSASYF
ncbi:hypothetical protein SBA3_1170021 [Candidatus Sulfopaludibacter sp. SbA3]|nr:hypothetical protein SBA3_1170021 [Candidatus Sulfopaludibacter sp. SbA3]